VLIKFVFSLLQSLLQFICTCFLSVRLFDFCSQLVVEILSVFCFALINLSHLLRLVSHLLLQLLNLLQLVFKHAVFCFEELTEVVTLNFQIDDFRAQPFDSRS
jgi:hypothetical protein